MRTFFDDLQRAVDGLFQRPEYDMLRASCVDGARDTIPPMIAIAVYLDMHVVID